MCLTEYARSLTMSSPRMFLPVPTPPSIWLWSWPFRTLQRVLHFRMNPCTLGWYLPLLVKDAPGALQPSDGDRAGELSAPAPGPVGGARPEEVRVPNSSSSSTSREARGHHHSPSGASSAAVHPSTAGRGPAALVSSQSPPARIRPGGNPTIIPWAQRVGVDAQKMHVMQTSLFRMPEEERALKALNEPQPRRKLLQLKSALTRKHSRDSEGEGLRADSRQVRVSYPCAREGVLKWRILAHLVRG